MLVHALIGLIAAQADPRIAVAAFRADGVSQQVADGVADILALELEKFQGVELLTRNDVKSILSQAAEAQLLGCEEPACYVDAARLLPSRRLLTGSVGRVGSTFIVQAALVDLVAARVDARASTTLAGSIDEIGGALKAIAVALLGGELEGLPRDVAVKAEITADMIDRVRVAQRQRGVAVHLWGGTMASTGFAIGEPSDPAYPGGAARVTVDVPLLPWLSLQGGVGGGYYVGRFVNQATFSFFEVPGAPEDTSGAFVADYAIGDLLASAGVEVQTPTGFVRPFARMAVTADLLTLDVSDLTYQPAAGQPSLPSPFGNPIPFRQSVAAGGGIELGLGTDFNVFEHAGLAIELAGYAKIHGLEKIALNNNVEQRSPLAPLTGMTLLLGAFYDF
jgi:TolB-like protein